jgi:RNA polymerase sigma-70 factor, ECF subfamily
LPETYRPGSPEDFERLYQTAYPRVFRTLAAIVDRQAAEDCAQDAFVQAWKAWKRWKPDAPAEAWVHRIALNRAIAYRRRARLRRVAEILRRLGRPATHAAEPAEEDSRSDLLTALRRIPPRQAAAIVLRHYHGYDNREIAAALGVSERTIGNRLRQAAASLLARLEPASAPDAPSALPSDRHEDSYARR